MNPTYAEPREKEIEKAESYIQRAIDLVERITPGNCSHKAGNIRVILWGAKDILAMLRARKETK